MSKTLKQALDQIVAFKAENPEQNRSGCLYEQDAQGEILRNYVIEDEVFKKCNFYTTKLISCQFIHCTFLECNFSTTEFINCKFIECTVNGCNFTNAILTDTSFKDCAKANNILNHLHCNGLNRGLNAKDENVMQDEILNEDEETAMEQDLKTVFTKKIIKIMDDNFSNWEIHENSNNYPSFTLSDTDQTFGISLYSNSEKNESDTDNFWELSIFFKDETLLTEDFNFFGQDADAIISIINNWKEEVIKNNASIIVGRMLEYIENK